MLASYLFGYLCGTMENYGAETVQLWCEKQVLQKNILSYRGRLASSVLFYVCGFGSRLLFLAAAAAAAVVAQ